ncbi:UNVERIFIED_CONTAM: hypothetical protein NCL1_35362 [Trichonephila clavipes]
MFVFNSLQYTFIEKPEYNRIQFVRSQKGTEMLIHDGFPFVRHFTTDKKTYWRCADFQKHRCTARIHTYESNFLRKISEHNHSCRNFSTIEDAFDSNSQYLYPVLSRNADREILVPKYRELPY